MRYHSKNSYNSPFLLAAGLHLLLFIILFVHFKLIPYQQPVVESSANVIKAVTVSQNQLQNELARLQVAEQAELQQKQVRQLAEEQAQQKLAQAQQAAAEAAEKAQKLAQALAQKQAQEQAQKQLEQQRIAQQQAAQKTALKLAQQQAASLQRQIQLAAQKKAAEQAKQKQLQLQKAKQLAQQLMQQEVAATVQAQQQTAADQGTIDKYKALIIQAISQQWIIPDTADKNAEGKLLVHLAPGGMVLGVQITQSSGDPILDRSAQTAVLKASPLPVPSDPALFENFRAISLTIRPKGILTGG